MVARLITFITRDGLRAYDATEDDAVNRGSTQDPRVLAILQRRGLLTPSFYALARHGWPYRCDPEALENS